MIKAQHHKPPEPVFTPFPELPAELQLKIWRFATYHRRTIKIEQVYMKSTKCRPQPDEIAAVKATIPPLIQTCHDSRVIALPKYSMVFERFFYRSIHFNPDTDTVWVVGNSEKFEDSNGDWQEYTSIHTLVRRFDDIFDDAGVKSLMFDYKSCISMVPEEEVFFHLGSIRPNIIWAVRARILGIRTLEELVISTTTTTPDTLKDDHNVWGLDQHLKLIKAEWEKCNKDGEEKDRLVEFWDRFFFCWRKTGKRNPLTWKPPVIRHTMSE